MRATAAMLVLVLMVPMVLLPTAEAEGFAFGLRSVTPSVGQSGSGTIKKGEVITVAQSFSRDQVTLKDIRDPHKLALTAEWCSSSGDCKPLKVYGGGAPTCKRICQARLAARCAATEDTPLERQTGCLMDKTVLHWKSETRLWYFAVPSAASNGDRVSIKVTETYPKAINGVTKFSTTSDYTVSGQGYSKLTPGVVKDKTLVPYMAALGKVFNTNQANRCALASC